MIKEAILYDGEKTVSSITGAEKTRQLHVKNEVVLFMGLKNDIISFLTQNGLNT